MPRNNADQRSTVETNRTDRAVSPVIGVILMVAITVILAAVIGVFVLGLGEEIGEGAAPAVTLSIEDNSSAAQTVTITNDGGDTLNLADDISVLLNGSVVADPGSYGMEELSPGESVHVNVSDDGDDSEIRIRHDPSGSILSTSEVDISP